MREFTKHHDIVAQIKAWFAKKQFTHVTMSEKVNFIGSPYDDYFVRTELVLSSSLNNFPHIKIWVTNDGAIGFGLRYKNRSSKFACGHQPAHISSDLVLALLEILAHGACAIQRTGLWFLGFTNFKLLIRDNEFRKLKLFASSADYEYATHYIYPCEELPHGKNVVELSAWL